MNNDTRFNLRIEILIIGSPRRNPQLNSSACWDCFNLRIEILIIGSKQCGIPKNPKRRFNLRIEILIIGSSIKHPQLGTMLLLFQSQN